MHGTSIRAAGSAGLSALGAARRGAVRRGAVLALRAVAGVGIVGGKALMKRCRCG
ncbi:MULTISPECIES: hypothetical protein [Streptomyces]|uniref:Uncharacterized protein n=1 Tax=Streptomyces lienomycini TaxID=284035 RepID=A0ABV9X033_9ACTN|nr:MULTISPECIES: hypothetical protein [Streptomyces]